MTRNRIPDYLIADSRRKHAARSGLRIGLWCAVLSALALILLVGALRRVAHRRRAPPAPVVVDAPEPIPPAKPLLRFGFPTAQTNLADTTSADVYMPTASGRVESALYGSTRTAGASGNHLPRFHAGIDIAPLRRARNRKPLDDILAIADGRVAYVQRAPGGSSYGRYIVLHHDDPVGVIYTLYAHLEAIASGIKPDVAVSLGQVIGRMGHSASTGIPVSRAHLHLEIGVFLHARFGDWLADRGLPRTHGVGHGWNLQAINPLQVLLERDVESRRSLLDLLRAEPVAFTLLLDLDSIPDFYRRHPDLWEIAAAPPPAGAHRCGAWRRTVARATRRTRGCCARSSAAGGVRRPRRAGAQRTAPGDRAIRRLANRHARRTLAVEAVVLGGADIACRWAWWRSRGNAGRPGPRRDQCAHAD